MNLCKDCKFVMDVETGDGRYAKCGICRIPTGFDNYNDLPYCAIHREANWFVARFIGLCGREGRWFEPKQP